MPLSWLLFLTSVTAYTLSLSRYPYQPPPTELRRERDGERGRERGERGGIATRIIVLVIPLSNPPALHYTVYNTAPLAPANVESTTVADSGRHNESVLKKVRLFVFFLSLSYKREVSHPVYRVGETVQFQKSGLLI